MIDRTLALAATLTVFSFAACNSISEVGKPCVLVKKNPDGGTGSVPILESEVQANKDFISFGAVECEDLVCVRDLSTPRPATATDTTAAVGYCSKPCAQTSTTACRQYDEALDQKPETKTSCRALLLDESTLAAICQNDPTTCSGYFGNTKSPYFCARGGQTDGGTP